MRSSREALVAVTQRLALRDGRSSTMAVEVHGLDVLRGHRRLAHRNKDLLPEPLILESGYQKPSRNYRTIQVHCAFRTLIFAKSKKLERPCSCAGPRASGSPGTTPRSELRSPEQSLSSCCSSHGESALRHQRTSPCLASGTARRHLAASTTPPPSRFSVTLCVSIAKRRAVAKRGRRREMWSTSRAKRGRRREASSPSRSIIAVAKRHRRPRMPGHTAPPIAAAVPSADALSSCLNALLSCLNALL